MTDFPSPSLAGGHRGVLSPVAPLTALSDVGALCGLGYGTTATTWTANRAVFQPVYTWRPVTITNMVIRVQTQNGNVDVGIYDWNNNLLVSSGSTAVAAAGVQTFDVTDTPLDPGYYKIAFSCSSSTAAFRSNAIAVATARMCGLEQQLSAFALPNPATTAAYATALAPLVIATYRTTI